MLTKKTNSPPAVTTAIVQPADMLRHVVIAGKTTRTAALELAYASAAFILIVNHFTDANAKGYMAKADAVKYLQKEISQQADVKGGMLDIYIRNASQLCAVLTGSAKMFSDVIQRLGTAATPSDMVSILSAWMDANHGKRIESMSSLSESLGYKTGRDAAPKTIAEKIERAPSQVATAVKNVEKIITESKGKLKESTVAAAIVNNVRSALTFAREAIKKITEEDDLKAIEAAVKEQRATLRRLGVAAAESVKERKVQATETKASIKKAFPSAGKTKPTATQSA